MEPQPVADVPCHTGENPLWHPGHDRLYWIDIPPGRLYRYDPATDSHELCLDAGRPIGGFTLQASGHLLLFMDKGTVMSWNDGHLETVIDGLPDEEDNRFNDVIADPAGRVFAGTMSPPHRPGCLYRLDPDRSVTTVFDDIGTSNGMGFTPDCKHLYYTDTKTGRIDICDYDAAAGALAHRRPFATVLDPQTEGRPDGLTVDADGPVWGARWDGSRLVRYTSDGQVDRVVPFPCRKVSSVIFGGDEYTDLYVTTAGGHLRPDDGPLAGALFRLRPGVRGRPEHCSRIAP
ncbi:MAG: SMP-30/gluconolactonase/LRE family protein [Planctomycetota bacterium]